MDDWLTGVKRQTRRCGSAPGDIEDVMETAGETCRENARRKIGQSAPTLAVCRAPKTAKELNEWFKFGCMSHPLVVHCEPITTCDHGCSYCYVLNYPGQSKRRHSEIMLRSTEQIIAATRSQADLLLSKMKKMRGTEKDDGMAPELHFSMSTDVLQPVPAVQEKSFIVMKAWLEHPGPTPLLLSLITKGIPYSADFQERLLCLMREHPTQISVQITCGSMDEIKQKIIERNAPAPEARMQFLTKIIDTKVGRISGRINPLVPGFNDSEQELRTTVDRMAETGVKRIAVSYMYGAPKIFANMQRMSGLDVRDWFDVGKVDLIGGCAKPHVVAERRRWAMTIVSEQAAKYGIVASACGCDNKDIFADQKCQISWRSE